MTTVFCTNCGAAISAKYCSQCGAAAAPPPPSIDDTAVRPAPLVLPDLDFPPPLYVADSVGSRPLFAPEPTVSVPPLHIAPAPKARHRDRAKDWLTMGTVIALLAAAFCMWFFGLRGHSASASPGSPPQEDWIASAGVGARPSDAQQIAGRAMFRSSGGNACVVSANETMAVTCVAAPSWRGSCQGGTTGPWIAFWLRPGAAGSTTNCDQTSSEALAAQSLTPAPVNTTLAMGSTGIYCRVIHTYVNGRLDGTKTAVACWNPASGHGFVIANATYHVW